MLNNETVNIMQILLIEDGRYMLDHMDHKIVRGNITLGFQWCSVENSENTICLSLCGYA